MVNNSAPGIDLNLPVESATRGVLVALSGGVDSTVLLYLARDWARKTSAPLLAVHVDHQLRPDSHEDARFCQQLCARLGVDLRIETLSINQRGSLQENARVQRYAALARVAIELNLGFILTAHHADDALETAVLNFRRGTSSGGLSALLRQGHAPIPDWPADPDFKLQLWRPLIDISRQKIVHFARQNQLQWHEDPTNQQSSYQRNHLRHDLMPALGAHDQYRQGMLDTLKNLADERDALDEWAEKALQNAFFTPPDAESIALDAARISKLPPAILTRVLQLAAARLPAPIAISRAQLTQIAMFLTEQKSARIDLRGALLHIDPHCLLLEIARGRGARQLARRRAGSIFLNNTLQSTSLHTDSSSSTSPNITPLPWFGTHFFSASRFSSPKYQPEPTTIDSTETPLLSFSEMIHLSDEYTRLLIRGVETGDRIEIKTPNSPQTVGHKSVHALLSEAQIPDFIRWRWPVIANADNEHEILWVCGFRAAPASTPTPTAWARHVEWNIPEGSFFGAWLHSSESGES